VQEKDKRVREREREWKRDQKCKWERWSKSVVERMRERLGGLERERERVREKWERMGERSKE